MKTAICAIIKDEHLFLEEWIEWHLGLGFDAIHLFEDKGSKSHEDICVKYNNVYLRRYEDIGGIKEIISEECFGGRQTMLYQWVCKNSSDDWVAFIDIDEFIIFEDGYSLDKLCQEYNEYPAVYLFWRMKSASGHIKRPSCSVMEAYTEDGPFANSDKNGWNFKSIVNIPKNLSMRSPHHAIGAVRTDFVESVEPIYKKAWINHYFTKSWEDWCDRIYNRGDVSRGNRTVSQFFECNPSMEHLRDELIASVADRIPNGTYWLDKQRGIIAGGNVRKIMSLNKREL